MQIRKANTDDFAVIQSIANIVWPATFGPLMPKEILSYMIELMYSTSSLKQQVEKNNIKYLIIEEDRKAIGYCSFEINYQDSNKLMIHRLYFLPEVQGKGYGTAVLNHLCAIGLELKLSGLTLKVLNNNNKAYQYYLKYGFKKTGEDYNHIGHNYPPFLDYVLEMPFSDE